MSIHLIRDLDSLHRDLLSMCAMVEELVARAVDSLGRPCADLTRELETRDDEIDRFDVQIEEECLKILALHQPVAIDLRRIASVLKITGELERVADLGVHIAERACAIDEYHEVAIPPRLRQMARLALDMLHRSIDAYVELDAGLARDICAQDDDVDRLNYEIIQELVARMKEFPEQIEPLVHLFSASRHVERIADHATNIAEMVVFMTSGEVVRHPFRR